MKVDDLWNKTVKEVLEEYCILYSPECDYNYVYANGMMQMLCMKNMTLKTNIVFQVIH